MGLGLDRIDNRMNYASLIYKKQHLMRNFLAEKSNKETEDTERRVRFFYCPRCGLRTLNSEILIYFGSHCPSCGCRMIDEGSLLHPSNNQNDHIEKSSLNRNSNFKKIC